MAFAAGYCVGPMAVKTSGLVSLALLLVSAALLDRISANTPTARSALQHIAAIRSAVVRKDEDDWRNSTRYLVADLRRRSLAPGAVGHPSPAR